MKTCFPWPGSKMISPSSPAFKTKLPSLVTIFGGFLRQWTKWRKVTSIIINKIVPGRLSYVETTVICLYFFPTLCGHIYFLLVWEEFFLSFFALAFIHSTTFLIVHSSLFWMTTKSFRSQLCGSIDWKSKLHVVWLSC